VSEAADVRPLRSAEWAASRLAVSRWQVYELAKRRALPSVKLGRRVLFDEEAIEAFIRSGGTVAESAAPSGPVRRISSVTQS
jgi:excisionase family DNA binding protein